MIFSLFSSTYSEEERGCYYKLRIKTHVLNKISNTCVDYERVIGCEDMFGNEIKSIVDFVGHEKKMFARVQCGFRFNFVGLFLCLYNVFGQRGNTLLNFSFPFSFNLIKGNRN